MPNVKTWLSAMRLRTLPLAFSCILMGSAVALSMHEHDSLVTLLALLTTLFLQILSNFANDYGDFSKGTDNADRVGPERTMQSGAINAQQMRKAMILTGVLALVSGIWLLVVAFEEGFKWRFLAFFTLGIGAIAAAVNYTVGKSAYGYRGMGDLFVFIFFGIVGVVGINYLHTLEVNWSVLLPAYTVGAWSAAVLNLNNMRDRVNDEASGKITLAIRLGVKGSKTYHIFLLISGCLSFFTFLILLPERVPHLWIFAIPIVVFIDNAIAVIKNKSPEKLDPQLKKVALATFGVSVLYFGIEILGL